VYDGGDTVRPIRRADPLLAHRIVRISSSWVACMNYAANQRRCGVCPSLFSTPVFYGCCFFWEACGA
jgi:hypothetical protein